jgi:hypothetical protein
VIREHYEAVKEMIPSGFTVYLFDTPATVTYPYVVVWGDAGQDTTEALGGPLDEFTADGRVTCVGANYASCLIVAQAVRNALNRNSPVVSGRHCQPLRLSPALDIQSDDTVTLPGTGTHPIFCVDEFTIQSEPS